MEGTARSEAIEHSGKAVPVQRRARRTRAALLAAVGKIVAAQGAEAVTTTAVAQATGVSVGTIYRYFDDRDALLLATYDGSVAGIVETCARALHGFPADLPREEAALKLLSLYLATADADPAHAGLLKAMRAIRPIASDQTGGNEADISRDLIAPFLARFAPKASVDPGGLHFLNVLLGTLVDLFLVTPPGPERERIRRDVEAHMMLALSRAVGRDKFDP